MPTSILSPTFVIGHIRIGSVEGASCVNLGNNFPTGFENHKKHNQGFGSVGGDNNKLSGIKAMLDDADMLDQYNGADKQMPDWMKEMINDFKAE